MNADAHRAAVEHMRAVNDLLNENDKEQSGAETVKIPARLLDPDPEFPLLVTARWRYFK